MGEVPGIVNSELLTRLEQDGVWPLSKMSDNTSSLNLTLINSIEQYFE